MKQQLGKQSSLKYCLLPHNYIEIRLSPKIGRQVPSDTDMLKKCIHQEFHFFSIPRKEPVDPREDPTPQASGHAPQGSPQGAGMELRTGVRRREGGGGGEGKKEGKEEICHQIDWLESQSFTS